jgi:hypothetical protein
VTPPTTASQKMVAKTVSPARTPFTLMLVVAAVGEAKDQIPPELDTNPHDLDVTVPPVTEEVPNREAASEDDDALAALWSYGVTAWVKIAPLLLP